MKSFATILMGIASFFMIAPIEYVLAQSTTVMKHRCEKTPANPTEWPVSVFCDRSVGHCNSTIKTYFYEFGECVYDAESTSCFLWESNSSQSYTVVFVDQGLMATQLGLALGAGVICFIYGGTGVSGLVGAVLCAGTAYVVSQAINACDFGYCKVDYTIPSVAGPRCFRCQ